MHKATPNYVMRFKQVFPKIILPLPPEGQALQKIFVRPKCSSRITNIELKIVATNDKPPTQRAN